MDPTPFPWHTNPSEIGGDYQFLADIAPFLNVAGWILTAVGAYLIFDGYRTHRLIGYAGTAAGILGPGLADLVSDQQSRLDQLDCNLYNLAEACARLRNEPSFFESLLDRFFDPLGLAITGACFGAGWLVAKMTRRKPPVGFVAED